ncbi:MAG: NCS2 family permease [Kiritimatiellia bacterium]
MNKFYAKLDSVFGLAKNNTSVRTEILGGLSTFLLTSYILAVNPNILGNCPGMPTSGIVVATALIAAIGTFLMGLLANYPLAIAPGMGLNAFFAFVVVGAMGYSWQFALFAVFVEGIIFLLMSICPIREKLFDTIPLTIKRATGAGIGLFIAFIGLQNAHIIQDNPATLISMISFKSASFHSIGMSAILTIVGVFITGILLGFRIRASILLGIFLTWIIGIICERTGLYVPDPGAKCFTVIPSVSQLTNIGASFRDFGSLFGQAFNFDAFSHTVNGTVVQQGVSAIFSLSFVTILLTFLFTDLFDTIGTLASVAVSTKMLDKNGRLPNIRGAFTADAVSTSVGAVFGTSTATTYVESLGGISVGARTGLAAYTYSILMLLALFLAPIFTAVPSFATAPALIIVGFMMMRSIAGIDWSSTTEYLPAFLTMIAMPLCYSISEGIFWGIISYTVLNLCTGRKNASKVSVTMIVLTILFILHYFIG